MEDFVPPEESRSLREQGGAVACGVRAAVLQAARHAEALAQLLLLELQEYRDAQLARLVRVAVGAVLLTVGYAFFCVGIVVVCSRLWGSFGACAALAGVVLLNLLVGLLLLLAGVRCKPQGIAPATCRELKDDIQCIKLYLKGKGRS